MRQLYVPIAQRVCSTIVGHLCLIARWLYIDRTHLACPFASSSHAIVFNQDECLVYQFYSVIIVTQSWHRNKSLFYLRHVKFTFQCHQLLHAGYTHPRYTLRRGIDRAFTSCSNTDVQRNGLPGNYRYSCHHVRSVTWVDEDLLWSSERKIRCALIKASRGTRFFAFFACVSIGDTFRWLSLPCEVFRFDMASAGTFSGLDAGPTGAVPATVPIRYRSLKNKRLILARLFHKPQSRLQCRLL